MRDDLTRGRHATMRSVEIGGMSKAALRESLVNAGVRFNDAAESLFADGRFKTSPVRTRVETVEVTAGSLGLAHGGTFAEIVETAAERGLSLCPLELGPHIRLQFLDQPEGRLATPVTQNGAPPGSVTVATAPLADDDETPKGFYLRRIDGVLWLRGYYASADHVWNANDRFLFAIARDTNVSC